MSCHCLSGWVGRHLQLWLCTLNTMSIIVNFSKYFQCSIKIICLNIYWGFLLLYKVSLLYIYIYIYNHKLNAPLPYYLSKSFVLNIIAAVKSIDYILYYENIEVKVSLSYVIEGKNIIRLPIDGKVAPP